MTIKFAPKQYLFRDGRNLCVKDETTGFGITIESADIVDFLEAIEKEFPELN